jgi:AcrR family transcriptional regulator
LRGFLNAVKFVAAVQDLNGVQGKLMGITERREREREHVRVQIVEAARDLLSEGGLNALSMRGIAERIEYSPATIYLYFRDKDELIRDVVHAGFELMGDYVQQEVSLLGGQVADPLARFGAMGRAYVRFALENTSYFRVMFELPGVAQVDCPADVEPAHSDAGFARVVETLTEASAMGALGIPDPRRAAVIGWGLMHGLTSLFLSGHLTKVATTPEEFLELIEEAKGAMYAGIRATPAAKPIAPAASARSRRGRTR